LKQRHGDHFGFSTSTVEVQPDFIHIPFSPSTSVVSFVFKGQIGHFRIVNLIHVAISIVPNINSFPDFASIF
jgi:hypothetical protein